MVKLAPIQPHNVVLLGGLAIWLSVASLGGAVINQLGNLGQTRQEEQYLERLELFSKDIEARLTGLANITLLNAEHISSHHRFHNGTKKTDPELQKIRPLLPSLRTMIVVNAEGVVVDDMRDDKPAVNINVSDREYFQLHLKKKTGEIQVLSPVSSRVDGQWTWVLSAAARAPSGDLLAVVVTSLDRRFFSDLFASQPQQRANFSDIFTSQQGIEPGFGLMIHEDGHILEASCEKINSVGQSLNTLPSIPADGGSSISRTYAWPSNNRQGTLLQKPVTGWPLQLLIFLDEEGIRAARRQSVGIAPYWLLGLLLAILSSTALLYANMRKKSIVEKQLWLSQEKLLQAQYLAGTGDFSWEVESGRVQWSKGTYRLLKYPPEEDITFDLVAEDIHHPDDHAAVMQWLSDGMQAKKTDLGSLEYRLLSKFGDVIDVQTTVRIHYENGRAKSVFGTILDVTKRKQIEEQIRQQEQKLALLLRTTGSGILSVDSNGICTSCNPAAIAILGYSAEGELLGINLHQAIHGKLADGSDYPVDWCPITHVLQSGEPCVTSQEFFFRKNGERFPIQLHAHPILDGGQIQGAVLSFIDISEQKRLEQRLYQQANRDSLTNLPNRSLLLNRLRRAISSAERQGGLLGVIFMDLDDFKNINDTLGHYVGDRLLQNLGVRLKGIMRAGDTIARMGGDEFVIVLERIENSEDASIVVRKIVRELAEPIHLPEGQLVIKASFGISLYPADGQDVETLLKAADTALYKAKEHHRGGYQYFAPSFMAEAEEMHRVEQQLSKALMDGHLAVAYQPILAAMTGELEAVEALLRFQPLQGYQNISVFKAIQVAERNGAIIEIGEWSLRQAIADVTVLAEKLGKPIKLHFNASSRQFLNEGFVDRIFEQLTTSEFPAQSLVLEITESSLLHSPAKAEKIAHHLANIGVLIALDDFGTGYSSLSYLAQFPVDIMKVDKSFVRSAEEGAKQKLILKSMIDFGNNLGMRTLCEGIEDTNQHQLINYFGCQQVQGFLYSRATSIDEISPQYAVSPHPV